MKKICLLLALVVALFCCIFIGCDNNELHWSYQACIDELVPNGILNHSYTYTVKEIEHQEVAKGNDEIHCFDITITKNIEGRWGDSERYCCFALVSSGEVLYVDCDKWEGIE